MLRDLRFALHVILKDRWYSAVAVVALALGIGVNATVFTLVNAVLIRGLPFRDSGSLYMLGSVKQQSGNAGQVSFADFRDWQQQSTSFSGLAAFAPRGVSVADDRAAPQQARGCAVTANTFGLLSQEPLVGRDFAPGDDRAGAEPVVMLGYAIWKTRYASDPAIVGRAIRINGAPMTVIGVMPDGMQFPTASELWIPAMPTKEQENRSARFLGVFGRLRPGVSRTAAQTEMNGIAARLAGVYSGTNKDFTSVQVATFNEWFNGGPIRTVFLAMMGAVAFVLLIACANVANLLLSRSVQRSREIAIRIALGASRWRVVRQLLIESTVLGFMGGAVGLLLALGGVRAFDAVTQNVGKPYWIQFTMDYTVFGFLAAVCLVTGVLFGLAPALQITRTNVNEVLKEGGRGNAGGTRARWMTGTMVVVELALTLVLLVGAGLMGRSFLKLYTRDLGIRTDHLLSMQMQLPESKYRDAAARRAFYERLAPRLSAIPGVESITFTTSVPPFGAARRDVDIEGRPVRAAGEKAPDAAVVLISPSFFDTIGVQLRRGRAFNDNDGAPGSEAVIVNELFASRLFPGEDPIGRRIRLTAEPLPGQAPAVETWRTIVGVAPTLRHGSMQDANPPMAVYVPYRQESPRGTILLARSRLDVGSIMNAVRREVQAVDQDQPVFTAQTFDDIMRQQRWPFRVFGSLFAIFAVIALIMSSVGLYAVMAYSVTQRTSEIGVRMALGADGRDVSWLVFRRGLMQMTIGLALGLAGAFAISRVLKALLVGITPTDPVTFVGITVLLAVVATAACLLPARRATRVDPLIALRAD